MTWPDDEPAGEVAAEGQVTSEAAMVHGELDGRAPATPALIDEKLADQLRFRPSESSSAERWRAIPHRQVMLREHSKPPKPARVGKCGRPVQARCRARACPP